MTARPVMKAMPFDAAARLLSKRARWLAWCLLSVVLVIEAQAQHAVPSAGKEQRTIKALSDDEMKQYLSGAGMRALLTDEQVVRYDALRGYASSSVQNSHDRKH